LSLAVFQEQAEPVTRRLIIIGTDAFTTGEITMMNRTAALVLGVCLLLPIAGIAATPESAAGVTALSTSTSSSGTDLRDLVRAVGQKTHKHFLMDPRVRATVELGDTEVRDVSYAMLLTILQINNFAAISDGNTVSVVPDANVRVMASPLVSPDNIKGEEAEVVTTIIPIHQTSAGTLAVQLRPLVAQWGNLAPIGEQNALLLVDRVANVKRIVAIAREIDKPAVQSKAP
jgi:general secretion pathway protein D